MSYFYGPLYSRRLGYSLGVNLVSKKICTFDCIYCQAGKCKKTKIQRISEINYSRLKKELKDILAKGPKIDYITFSGTGEPTLHKGLDKIIRFIKKISRNKYPVCIITNSSLLYRKKVRQELKEADLVIPSLDGSNEKTFQKINNPHGRINLDKIVKGLVDFRKEFRGKIWLEIMIIGRINDSLKEAYQFKKIIDKIRPDKVQINLPVRPSPEKVLLPRGEKLEKIKRIINGNIEVIIS